MHFRSSTEQNILQNNQFQYKHQVNQIKNKNTKHPCGTIRINTNRFFGSFRCFPKLTYHNNSISSMFRSVNRWSPVRPAIVINNKNRISTSGIECDAPIRHYLWRITQTIQKKKTKKRRAIRIHWLILSYILLSKQSFSGGLSGVLPGRGARRRFFRGHQPLQALEWNRPMAWPGYHHINPHNHITSSILSIFFLLLLFTLDGMFDWAQPNCFSFFPVLFPSCCRKCYFPNSKFIHFAVRFDLSAVLLCTSVTKNAIVWLMNVAVLYECCLFFCCCCYSFL